MKNFIVSWKIYPFDVMVSVKERQEDIVKRIERTGYKLDADEKEKLWMTGQGRTVMLRGGQTILRLDTLKHGVISHEVFHAVDFLMNKVGIKLTEESDEAYAYAIEYLTNEIYKNLKKPKKARK